MIPWIYFAACCTGIVAFVADCDPKQLPPAKCFVKLLGIFAIACLIHAILITP